MNEIYKAQGHNVPDLNITASKPVYGSRNQQFFRLQAMEIADKLFASLPQGTIDALRAEFLDRNRSSLVAKDTPAEAKGE